MKKILTFALLSAFALGAVSCGGGGEETKPEYTVTFNADGGTPAPAAQKVKEGETVTAPPAMTKTGYVFLFWSQNGTAAYNFSLPVTSNITLSAHWQSEATAEYWQVTWELNGGAWPSGDNHVTQVVKGGTLAEPAPPTKTGSTFDGWYREEALTNKITFPYDVSALTANFTLYAKWTTGGGNPDPEGTFSSIAALKTWLASQPANTVETPYEIALKGVNLDSGNNWNDLGLAIKGDDDNDDKYVALDLSGCTGTTIPDGNSKTTLEDGKWINITHATFVGCNLTSITLPESVKTIGAYAFRSCESLSFVSLPDGLTEIRKSAFDSNDALKSISLPGGLKIIGESAFGDSALESVSLPDGLETIGGMAFSITRLTSITIPGSVKNIGYRAFIGSSLRTVVLEEGVETIGENAFGYCHLESVTLPSGLKTIGAEAFCSDYFNTCLLNTITIPASVRYIDNHAFENTRTDEVIMLPATPPVVGSGAFWIDNEKYSGEAVPPVIKVPSASLDAYKTSSGWSYYANYIVANE